MSIRSLADNMQQMAIQDTVRMLALEVAGQRIERETKIAQARQMSIEAIYGAILAEV